MQEPVCLIVEVLLVSNQLTEYLKDIKYEKQKITPQTLLSGVKAFGIDGGITIQNSKLQNIFTNGSHIIVPDAGYSSMQQVTVTVDVPSEGEYSLMRLPETLSICVGQEGDTTTHSSTSSVDGSNSWIYRTFLKHNLSELPSGATVYSARLYFYVASGNDNYSQSECLVSKALGDWTEATKWSTQPNTQAYSNYIETPLFGIYNGINKWYSVDVTPIVKSWVSGTANYGICLKAKTEGQYRRNWNLRTRMYSTGDFATYIEVIYAGGV